MFQTVGNVAEFRYTDHRHPDFHNIDTSSIPRDPDMKPAFVVLGTFFVTEVWQEMGQDGNRNQYPVVKLMLQRIHTADKPSYWQGEYHTAQVQDIRESFMQYICGDCSKTSPVAFRDHPSLCLNHHCQSFFCVDGVQLQRDLLEYSQGFLDWIKPFSGDVSMIPAIIPPAPSKNNGEYGTELRFRTGLVCPSCKHCNSRVWFNYWKCGSCGLVQMAEPEPYPLSEIDEETLQHVYKLRKNRFFKSDQTTIFYAWDLVDKFTKVNQNSVRTTYLITEEDGTFGGAVVHERPSAAMMQASCGANELWNEIQQPGVAGSFRRYPAVCPGSKYRHGKPLQRIPANLLDRHCAEVDQTLHPELRKYLATSLSELCANRVLSRVSIMIMVSRSAIHPLRQLLMLC